jgi:hypothetical protein
VPIAAGENLRSLWEFKNYIAAGAVSILSPTSPIGAASPAFMKIARLAEAFPISPVTSHGRTTSRFTSRSLPKSFLSRGARFPGSIDISSIRSSSSKVCAWRRCGPATASASTGRDWRSWRNNRQSGEAQQVRQHGRQSLGRFPRNRVCSAATPALFLLEQQL